MKLRKATMKCTKGLLGAACLLLAAAVFGSSYFPEFYHLFNPKVGGWSTYHVKDARGEESVLTFAVVRRDAKGYWLELRTPQEGGSAVAAFLLKGDPTDDANVLAVRVQGPGSPAVEMDRETLEKLKTQGRKVFGGNASPIGPTFGKLVGLPEDSVTVDGKKIPCRHLKVVDPEGKSAEVWLNEKIVPFGIVKLVSGQESVALEAYGKGARPMLTGPVKKLVVP